MRAGRILAVLLLAAGVVGSVVSETPIYMRLLYTGLLLLLVSWIWTQSSLQNLRVVREARSLRASVGDIFEEHYEVCNDGRLPCLWLEVKNDSSIPFASGSRLLTRIGGRQRHTYIARTWLTRRGAFELGPTMLTSGDPIGLFSKQRAIPAVESLVVVPMIAELESFVIPAGILTGGEVIRRRAAGITPHASGIREYVTGDPIKRIHWPSSARRGRLMSKEFDQDPQAEVWIFLDAQAGVHAEKEYDIPAEIKDSWLLTRRPEFSLPPSTLEYAISITASLAHFFIKRNRAVGFMTAGQVQSILSAERSHRQEDKILDLLAFLDAKGRYPIGSLSMTQARQLPQGASVILVTPSVDPEFLLAVDVLQRRNMRVMVILLMAESFGGEAGSEKILNTLTERGAPVCPVYCGTDIAGALTGFGNSAGFQEAKQWQTKPFIPST